MVALNALGASNFLDGDLIERFLDLPHDKMREVSGNLHGLESWLCEVDSTSSFIFFFCADQMAGAQVCAGFQRADSGGVLRDLTVQDVMQAVEEMTRLH